MSHALANMKAQRVVGNQSVTTLAKAANVSDMEIVMLENGGNIGVDAAQRIADALGVSLTTLGKSDR